MALPQQRRGQRPADDVLLQPDNLLQPVQEPEVDPGDVVDFLHADAPAQRLGDDEQTLVVDVAELLADGRVRQLVEPLQVQRVDVLLQRAHAPSSARPRSSWRWP